MEDTLKDQSSASGNRGERSGKLLRYPLRSSGKSKDDKPPVPSPATASASRRGRTPSSVSQSVGVLDVSAKEKSAKPPRRLSIPTKATASPARNLSGNVTPISEARANRSGNIKGKSDTPGSDASRSLNRKKFNVLSSASYWLSQIKHSEVAAKHQVSLGFFKLALEAQCENVQLLRDELKSYARRHNLLDLGESAKEVFESYNISESIEQLQVSETCSHVPEEGTKSSDDDARSSSSIAGDRKLKPRPLNNGATSAAKKTAKVTTQKSPVPKIRASANNKMANQSPALKGGNHKTPKNTQKLSKQESNKEKHAIKTEEKKVANDEDALNPSPVEAVLEENKENMDAPVTEEISLEA